MAELSRVRPDLTETEDQLLELQRAFLASQDHKANAAARVTRVGGAPPKDPSPENLAGVLPEDIRAAEAAREPKVGASQASQPPLDGFGTGPAHGFDPTAQIREVVGEVVERAPRSRTGAPMAPTAPTAPGPGLAFPEAKHRTKGPFAGRKSKFMMEREKKAAEAAAAAGGGADTAVAVGGIQPPDPTKQKISARLSKDDETKGIEDETSRRLAAMSVSEIEDAVDTIAAKLKPSALEFFRKRGADKLAAKSETTDDPAADAELVDAAQQQPAIASTSSTTPPTSPPRSTKKPPLSPARPVDPAPAAPAAAASTMASSSESSVAQVRFTLEGVPLNADEQPIAGRQASRLGSAVERDPLRSGTQNPADLGYSTRECLELARSSVPAQRSVGLSVLTRVLAHARRWGGGGGAAAPTQEPLPNTGPLGQAGAKLMRRRSVGMVRVYGGAAPPSNPLGLPTPLPTGVHWGDVWLHALVDHNAVLLLRRSLDDGHLPAAAAAAGAIAALVGGATGGGWAPSEVGPSVVAPDQIDAAAAADWFDALESAPPSGQSLTCRTTPLWRSGGWGVTFAPFAWEQASGPITLTDQGAVVHDPADEVSEDGGEMGDEERKSRGMAHAVDPIAALLRMGLLPRCRYLLEVGKHPACVSPVLATLAACARHSAAAATAVARCPRLLQLLVSMASGEGGEYPPGTPAGSIRVLRIIASSAPEHARRLGADGVVTAAVQSAVGAGHKTAEGASLWSETLRLWSAVAQGGGATPSVDGLFPLLAPMMEPSTASTAPRSPFEAATAAALAAECFALFAALTSGLRDAAGAKFDETHGWVPPEVDDNGVFKDVGTKEAFHPSTSLTMTSESGGRLSWACAAGAAASAEAWCVRPPVQPPEPVPGVPAGRNSKGGYSPAAWRAAGNAAHFLSSLIEASGVGGENESSAAATAAGQRVLGLVRADDKTDDGRVRDDGPVESATKGVGVLAADGLVEGALDALGSSANDMTDPELAGRAAFGVALHGALRLAAAVRGACGSPLTVKLAGRTVRQLTLSASISIQANAGDGDGVIRQGRASLVAAAELPSQRALVVALELQEAAVEAAGDEFEDEDDEAGIRREGAIAAVEATAAIVRALPPGAGSAARDAISAGLLAKRTLSSILRIAAERLDAAVKADSTEDGEVHGGFSQFAARDLELETTTAEHPGSLVPSHTAARDALLGGFAMELTSARERLDAVGESPPPLDGVGSTTPLPPLPQWLLAACSSKSTVDGWGPDGAASCLALLLGLETSGSLVTRDLPAEAKLAAVSGIFCLGPGTWRNPSVSAAAAALTDTYWGRLEEEKEANSANPRMGQHSYGEAGFGTGDEDEISTQAAASLAQDVCEAFSNESFGDKLFARHAAFQLRDGAPARARAAAWLALREGVAFHLLPPMPAVAPRPERGDAYMFLPPGGEKDPEMLELYVQCLETGALDKSLTGTNTGGIPSLSAALALHAATHAVFKDTGVASSATVLRRLLNRPNTGTVLRGIMCTPLTQRRRPAVARAAAAGTRRVSVDGAGSNFGPGFAYRMDPPVNNVEARRSVMLAACGDDSGLRKELRVALMEAIPPPPLSDDDDDDE